MRKHIQKNIFLLGVFLLSAAVLVEPVSAHNKKHANSAKKTKIFVEYKLYKENLSNDDNILVDVKNDTITLQGTVPTIHDKNEAGEVTMDVADGYKVVNNLAIAVSQKPDSVVVIKVLKRIRRSAFYSVFNWVTANDTDGVITLTGWVHMPWYKTLYQREAEKVAGVRKVINKIQNTFGPGDLGIRAARLIYSDPTSILNGYQYFADPPIHIIVVNGSIILAGNVSSKAIVYWAIDQITYKTNAINVINDLKVEG